VGCGWAKVPPSASSMRKPPFIPVLLSCLLAVAGHAAEAWTSDFQAALRRAKSEGKTVLLDFTGSDWCAGCRRSRTKVLEKPEFLAYAAKHLVLVEVDFPERKPQDEALKRQNAELEKRYKVSGYPAFVLVDADGEVLGRHDSLLQDPAEFLRQLDGWRKPAPKPKEPGKPDGVPSR
jgi:thioredoxin-related protein